MKKSEKFTIVALIIAITSSASIYGMWEDKYWFFTPLLALIYIALAAWSVGACRRTKVERCVENNGAAQSPPSSGICLPPAGLLLLLFWVYSAVMIPFSAIPYEAKISTFRVGAYIGVYWATACILSKFKNRKTALMTVFGVLILISLYSLVQHKIAPEMIFGVERYTRYWKTGVGGRLGGTYQCPNHIAHLFQMWIPFCILFLFIPRFGWFWRICFGYSIPLFTLLIYQTQSRAGLLGLVASLATMALLLMLRKSQKMFYLALVIVPLLGMGSVAGLWFGSSMFRERMEPVEKVATKFFSGKFEEAISVDFRPQTWADGMVMFADNPVTGFGPGSYELVFPKYRQRVLTNRILTVHPHNELVELLGEYGLIGLFLVIGILIRFCTPMVRLIRRSDRPAHALPAIAIVAALVGTGVHGFFDFELRIFSNALMLALLAGVAAAPVLQTKQSAGLQPKTLRILRPLTALLLLLVAAWSLQTMTSATLRLWGDKYREEKNGLGQIYSHHRYYELDPVLKRKMTEKEHDEFLKAYKHNVIKEEVVYGLGRSELAFGNRTAGIDYFRQAAHYKRFNDFYWRKLGMELRKDGFYEEAMETFLYAQKLDRSNKTVNRNIQWLKKKMAEDSPTK